MKEEGGVKDDQVLNLNMWAESTINENKEGMVEEKYNEFYFRSIEL